MQVCPASKPGPGLPLPQQALTATSDEICALEYWGFMTAPVCRLSVTWAYCECCLRSTSTAGHLSLSHHTLELLSETSMPAWATTDPFPLANSIPSD